MRISRKISLAAIAVAAATIAVAGCGTKIAGQPATHFSTPSAAARASAAAATPPNCSSQLLTWANGGGLHNIVAVQKDLGRVSRAGLAANLGRLQAGAITLGSDSQAAQSDLPPTCVPGMRANLQIALNDFVASAASAGQGTIGGIQAAGTQISAGGQAITRATTALTTYESGH